MVTISTKLGSMKGFLKITFYNASARRTRRNTKPEPIKDCI
jgi:hypothetical protein